MYNNRGLQALSLLICALAIGGCAYVTATPVSPDSWVGGIRIYDVKPILIVNESNVTVQLVPNYNRAYALNFGAFLAKHDFQVEFESGFIKSLKSNQDSTAIIELLKVIAQQAFAPTGKGFSAQETSGASGRFGVFEFGFDDHGNLLGLRPLLNAGDLIRLPSKPRVSSAGAGQNVPQPPSGDVPR